MTVALSGAYRAQPAPRAPTGRSVGGSRHDSTAQGLKVVVAVAVITVAVSVALNQVLNGGHGTACKLLS